MVQPVVSTRPLRPLRSIRFHLFCFRAVPLKPPRSKANLVSCWFQGKIVRNPWDYQSFLYGDYMGLPIPILGMQQESGPFMNQKLSPKLQPLLQYSIVVHFPTWARCSIRFRKGYHGTKCWTKLTHIIYVIYIYMYVFWIYVMIYIYIYLWLYVYIYILLYTCIYDCIYKYDCICIYDYIYNYNFDDIYIWLYIWLYMYIWLYI